MTRFRLSYSLIAGIAALAVLAGCQKSEAPAPAETSEVVTDVVASLPGTEVLDTPAVLSDVPAVRAADPRFAQLWPHRHGTDAIFIALLRRTS